MYQEIFWREKFFSTKWYHPPMCFVSTYQHCMLPIGLVPCMPCTHTQNHLPPSWNTWETAATAQPWYQPLIQKPKKYLHTPCYTQHEGVTRDSGVYVCSDMDLRVLLNYNFVELAVANPIWFGKMLLIQVIRNTFYISFEFLHKFLD